MVFALFCWIKFAFFKQEDFSNWMNTSRPHQIQHTCWRHALLYVLTKQLGKRFHVWSPSQFLTEILYASNQRLRQAWQQKSNAKLAFGEDISTSATPSGKQAVLCKIFSGCCSDRLCSPRQTDEWTPPTPPRSGTYSLVASFRNL